MAEAPFSRSIGSRRRPKVASGGGRGRLPCLRALACQVLAVASLMATGAAPGRAGEWGGGPPPSEPRVVSTDPARVDPVAVLPGIDPESLAGDTRAARAAQETVRAARIEVQDTATRERIACYRRFLVNACLADVDRRARMAEARLDGIEVAANQSLREAAALELNRQAAARNAERDASAAADAAGREENRRAAQAREAAAEEARAAREREAPVLIRRTEANRAERARREAENATRREEAARREGEERANIAARERAIESNRRREEARAAKELERREQGREEAARRLEQERRLAEPPPARRRSPAPAVIAPTTPAAPNPPAPAAPSSAPAIGSPPR